MNQSYWILQTALKELILSYKGTKLVVSFILYKLWAGAKQIFCASPFTASLFLVPVWIWWSVNNNLSHVRIVIIFYQQFGNFCFAAYHPLNCSSSPTRVRTENQSLPTQLNLLAVFLPAFQPAVNSTAIYWGSGACRMQSKHLDFRHHV